MQSYGKQNRIRWRRARLYHEVLEEYPRARADDITAMCRTLHPNRGDRILGVGEGNGFFKHIILNHIGKNGRYVITDPSADQLSNVKEQKNLETRVVGAEDIDYKEEFDKVWCFGSFHHIRNQTKAMRNIHKALVSGGTAVIYDVFSGSKLARHFDSEVARYCGTGHEVKFLSDEFARSLCYLAGFEDEKVEILEREHKWRFNSPRDLARFLYKLHGLTKLGEISDDNLERIYRTAEKILGVQNLETSSWLDKKVHIGTWLSWPMKVLIATK